MEEYKIPVIVGINDIPLPPNYNGNGKSCNGAFYIQRFNDLVDLLDVALEYNNPLISTLEHNLPEISPFLREIGTEFLSPNESLELLYTLSNTSFNPTAMVYAGEDKTELAAISPPYTPGDIWEYYPTPYSILPNVSQVKETWYLRFQGQNEKGLGFTSDFVEIKWVPMGYVGQSTNDNLQDNYLDGLGDVASYLKSPGEFIKSLSSTPEYVYILWPVGNSEEFPTITGVVDGDNLFPISLVNMGEKTVSKPTHNWVYNVYRTSLPTNSSYRIKIITE